MRFSAWACVKVGHRLNFHGKRRLVRQVMAVPFFVFFDNSALIALHEIPRMRKKARFQVQRTTRSREEARRAVV